MFRSTSKGIGAGMVIGLIFIFLSIFGVGAGAAFVKFFKYHMKLEIDSDATESKSSLIPLVMITSTYNDEDFTSRFNKAVVGIVGLNSFKSDLKKLVDHYFDTSLCYRSEIEDAFVFDNFQDAAGIGVVCKEKSFYKIIFPAPIVFDGKGLNKTLEFSIHETEIVTQVYP